MRMVNDIVKFFLLVTMVGPKFSMGYYDMQPKLLSEAGSLVIESAVDQNVLIRLRGRGTFLVNEFNVLQYIKGVTANQSIHTSSEARIAAVELIVETLQTSMLRFRGLNNRISAIENRTRLAGRGGGGSFPRNQFVFQRRVMQLERRVTQIVTSLNTNNCKSNPCEHGGTCVSMFETFMCRCPGNWEGPTCDVDVNECAAFAGTDLGCQNGGDCMNTPGSYSCHCPAGWVGLHCSKRSIDCLAPSNTEICGHGTCVHTNDETKYKCLCEAGWTNAIGNGQGSSPACTIDINECSDKKPHCSMDPVVQCVNLPGTYMCGFCPAGYTGNGHYCLDVNECETNNGGCSTSPSVQCINTRGSFQCGACPTGWQGDGRTCVRSTSEGSCSRADLCHPAARCVEGQLGPTCICPNGYTGSGFGPYGCRIGYTDPCATNPCLNGGTCAINGTSFRCHCEAGYELPLCTEPTNPCASNPCRNGGTCLNLSFGRYSCQCTASFQGTVCQTGVRSCGGLLSNEQGTLRYPLSDTYEHNSRCAWLIRTNATLVLNITFTKFNLEPSSECKFDWLQIHDGRFSSSYMIGRFCGNTLPKNFISTTNNLYLWFRSDNSSSHDGFELTWDSIAPICGGHFDITTYGTLSSPGSPGNYPPNRDCEWNLIALPGKRIQMHFYTMQLEAHETCQYDYLAIYDGGSVDDGQQLAKFCNTSSPEPLTTTYNEATLLFHSDGDNSDAGFQIHYSVVEGFPGCGGTFTSNKGEFGSPIQDGVYPKNIICEFVIRLPNAKSRIKIHFKQFKLEPSSECIFDYVRIHEGSTSEAPEVGKFCGSDIPNDYISTGNVLMVAFKSDWSFSHEGFRIGYEIVCGGTFSSETGIITSPGFPQSYESERECIFEIESDLGKAIVLEFIDFDMEDTSYPSCDYDYLEIYDGHININSSVLGKFCGTIKPPQIISTHNLLTLKFLSDSSVSGRGFKANFSQVDSSCGGVIRVRDIEIKPPRGRDGDTYGVNANCTWIIVAPSRHIVQLSFSSFSVESFPGCSADHLTLIDGNPLSNSIIGKYCGTRMPPITSSSGTAMTLVFVTDASYQMAGFTATYSFIDSSNLCGGRYYTSVGTLHSPGWPNEYKPDHDCTWIISAPAGQQIELTIKVFEVEPQFSCHFDYLEIRNGDSNQSPLIGRYCTSNFTKQIRSFANTILLQFVTDSTRNYRGFEIDWDSSSRGCGGQVTQTTSGVIMSPNYPASYGQEMQCDWRITVAKGSTIQVVFSDLDMESHSRCLFDSIELFDGRSAAAKSLAKLCSQETARTIETSDNVLYLRMQSDYSSEGRGFDLRYASVCNRVLTNHRGVIQSPNYPGNYPDNLNCEWKITAPKGNTIYVAFTDFKFEHDYDGTTECFFDHVQIEQRDERDVVVQTQKYCRDIPKAFTSFTSTVVIRMVTDYSNVETGFSLEYAFQGCGDSLIRPTGNFASPNYPLASTKEQECAWSINIDFGFLIELSIEDLDMKLSPNCSQNALSVAFSKDGIAARYCGQGTKLPIVLTSHSNEMDIKFTTNPVYGGRGFKASYRSVPLTCGGRFMSTNSFIMSPHFPQNYEPNLNCEWLIETDTIHRLELVFMSFTLEHASLDSCQHDYVRVYDGSLKNPDTLMGIFCGDEMPNRTFTSTHHQLLVVMVSDNSIELSGFKAVYSTACGSVIETDDTGLIALNDGSIVKNNCNWTIISKNLNQHIVVTILSMYTDATVSGSCPFKSLVYDGDSVNATKTKEICANGPHPPPIVSTGHAVTLSLTGIENNELSSYHFEARYSVLDNSCGSGTFTSKHGKIASPAYPKTYPVNIECVWRIESTPGNQILLTIEELDIFESEHCNDDYLEVRDTNENGKVLGVYCGSTLPSVVSMAERMWLKFRSGNDGVGKGFLVNYNYALDVELTKNTGIITSPIFPRFDYVGEDRSYRIVVDLGSTILVTITHLMVRVNTELKIYDGYDATGVLLNTFRTVPDDAISSISNVLYVVWSVADEGQFRLTWTKVSVDNKGLQSNQTETLNCTANSLVSVNTRQSINISSPGFPFGYGNQLDCHWTLVPAAPGYHVTLFFLTVNLEDTVSCVSDYVQVSSSADLVQYNTTAKLCNANFSSQTIYHGTPFLKLDFISDWYTNGSGFNSVARLECGGMLTLPTGIINKEMARNEAMLSMCEWKVAVRPGRTISVTFEELHMRKDANGHCDSYIILRNGHYADSPFLGAGQYCGNAIPVIPNTIGNHLFVQFYTGAMLNVVLFSIRYQEVSIGCDATILLTPTENSTVIMSPNYPQIPNAFSECTWKIIAPHGELLQIDFVEHFDLTHDQTCSKEVVEVRDGMTQGANIIGRYCNEMPSTIRSTSNFMSVRYFTEVSVPKNGFKAKVSVALCGGYYRGNAGHVQSTNYPGLGAYPSDTTCEYRIIGPSGATMNITFEKLDLPEDENCTIVDHVTVYNILHNETVEDGVGFDEIGTYCGSDIPSAIISGPGVMIKFVTYKPNTLYAGFRLTYSTMQQRCGGDINAERGVITSPGYPVGRTVRQFCEWRIVVPKGSRVRVDFDDYDMMSTQPIVSLRPILSRLMLRSFNQRLTFYNDLSYLSRIQVLLPTDPAMTIRSSDNRMLINLWMRSNAGHRGFKLTFSSSEPSTCTGNLNAAEGSLRAPENATSYYCEYQRQPNLPLIDTKLGVGTMALRIRINSTTDNSLPCLAIPIPITVTYTKNTRVNPIVRNCNESSMHLNKIMAPFQDLKISTRNAPWLAAYTIDYKVHNCGGIIDLNESYTLSQPRFSAGYAEVACAWQFKAMEGMKIKVFVTFNELNCETDSIDIYNGAYAISPKIDHLCNKAGTFDYSTQITHESLLIEFQTNAYNPVTTFNITIVSSYELCGGILESGVHEFFSPSNGTQYPNNVECIWDLKAKSGYHIGLSFVDRFYVQESINCTKDFVEVFDKVDTQWVSLGRVCGRSSPAPFNSTGTMMRVLFHSDATIVADGFAAVWRENCGGTFVVGKDMKYLTSPRYPEKYPRNIVCNYTIVAESDAYINVQFLHFEMEETSRGCNYDNLTIYRHREYYPPESMELMGTYCYHDTLSYLRYKGKINLIFSTDMWLERKGFNLKYYLDSCGGNVHTTTAIEVPRNPITNSYNHNLVCLWNVTVPADKKIVVRFEHFDLEQNDYCYIDYVEVYEGSRLDSEKRLAHLCGNLTNADLPVINVQSNRAVIKFQSDASTAVHGMSAIIMVLQSCDMSIDLSTSHTYNLNKMSAAYADQLDCHYTITAPVGYAITATFDNFHLAPCTNNNSRLCDCDFVELRDGGGPFAELIGNRLCGHELPTNVTSTSSRMWMRFATDSMNSSTGFAVKFSIVESPCGMYAIDLNETATQYVLNWPGGSKRYPPNTRCQWQFKVPFNNIMIFTFDKLDTPEPNADQSCTDGDYLEILDNSNNQYIPEGLGQSVTFFGRKSSILKPSFYQNKYFASAPHIYCGTVTPTEFISASEAVLIKFRSNADVQKTGFTLTANILRACHRNYTALEGRIMSKVLETCETYITVPQNFTIALFFTRFTVYPSDYKYQCNEDNSPLKVYDGGVLLQTICAQITPMPIFSNTSTLTLKFNKIDYLDTGYVYDITYVASNKGCGCGGQLFNYGGQFSSPMYPTNVRDIADCRWDITVPQNLVVALQFEVFDMGNICKDNFVQIIEYEENGEEKVVRQFCGLEQPSNYTSSHNMLTVRFKKNVNFGGTGWLINFMGIHPFAVVQLY